MDAALRHEYLAWLRGHIAKMLALPGFLGANIMMPFDPPPSDGRWMALRDRGAGQSYLAGHAARRREAGWRDSATV